MLKSAADCFLTTTQWCRYSVHCEIAVVLLSFVRILALNFCQFVGGLAPLCTLYIGIGCSGKCLYLSGLIPEPMNACDDYRLKEIGIGFTNFVSRCSKGSVELTRYLCFLMNYVF